MFMQQLHLIHTTFMAVSRPFSALLKTINQRNCAFKQSIQLIQRSCGRQGGLIFIQFTGSYNLLKQAVD